MAVGVDRAEQTEKGVGSGRCAISPLLHPVNQILAREIKGLFLP